MCLTNETVDELHAVTSAMKRGQDDRDSWLAEYDKRDGGDGTNGVMMMAVSRAEGEQLFAQRIAAHESRLAELGWSRKVRVSGESQPQGDTK